MAPGVSRLERQPVGEATVHPDLQCMIMRVTRRLAARYRPKPRVNAVRRLEVCLTRIDRPNEQGILQAERGVNVIVRHTTPPDMQAVVAYVRGFHHRILDDFARDGQVPLPALRR